jgi:hypothetical protein
MFKKLLLGCCLSQQIFRDVDIPSKKLNTGLADQPGVNNPK